jgi:hypothetical protein
MASQREAVMELIEAHRGEGRRVMRYWGAGWRDRVITDGRRAWGRKRTIDRVAMS